MADREGPRTIHEDLLATMQAERAEVNALLAQGDEGSDLLRQRRVQSYVEATFADGSDADQAAAMCVLMPLAKAADVAIGDTPNSLTFREVEERLGADQTDGSLSQAAYALRRAGLTMHFHQGVLNFLHAYHTMHATRLITDTAVQGYQTLARDPDVDRTITPGRQRSSNAEPYHAEHLNNGGWVSLRATGATPFSGIPFVRYDERQRQKKQ